MLGPVATTVFFCLILSFSRWLVRGDARFLLDFLAMALDAREGDDLPRYSLAAAELRSRGR